MSSVLENRFLHLWEHKGGAPLEREYRFHPERRWKADFAHLGRSKSKAASGAMVVIRHPRASWQTPRNTSRLHCPVGL